MFVIRPISTVFINVNYFWLIHMYILCKEVQCWEWKCITGNFLGVGSGNSNNKFDLQVIAEKTKISSYLDVGKCPYPQYVS